MLKKINDFLAGWPMTLVGGVFLMASLAAPWLGIQLPVDPAWITVIVSGLPLLYLALWRVVHNTGISKISSALLISIAMFAAVAIGDLFAAGEVAFIRAIGALLEDATTNRAKKGLKKLISLAPVQGRRLVDGREEMIPAAQIRPGDLLRILPGEAIPVDGVIQKGETTVDQSIMTGESLPVDKGQEDPVYCGTINRFGAIDITATKVGEDSSLQKLIRMVQDAEQKQAPMQRIADQCASWLVPVALLIAVLAYVFTGNIVTAVTILVVFCPCALVLATPTAIMAAIGQATKHGVIIKSGEALEKMGKVDTIAFDKTGTLTYGRLDVSDVRSFDPALTEDALLALAASAEAKSEHPLGKAIVAHARAKGLSLQESSRFSMAAGRGVYAEVAGRRLLCGSERFLEANGATVGEAACTALEKLRSQGKASILVAQEEKCVGVIALSDVIRPEARNMVSRLRSMGAGRGTICYGMKGGIGSASRQMTLGDETFTLGVLVQSNYGASADFQWAQLPQGLAECDRGSIIMVVATDLPLSHRQLRRVIKRASVGMARLGSYVGHGSGEIMVGFTTAPRAVSGAFETMRVLREEEINLPFRAVGECCEEAILKSMLCAHAGKTLDGEAVPALSDLLAERKQP